MSASTAMIDRAPMASGMSSRMTASNNSRPIPGHEKMVSVMIPPLMTNARARTSEVTTGSNAFRAACLSRITFSDRPLARAVRM